MAHMVSIQTEPRTIALTNPYSQMKLLRPLSLSISIFEGQGECVWGSVVTAVTIVIISTGSGIGRDGDDDSDDPLGTPVGLSAFHRSTVPRTCSSAEAARPD